MGGCDLFLKGLRGLRLILGRLLKMSLHVTNYPCPKALESTNLKTDNWQESESGVHMLAHNNIRLLYISGMILAALNIPAFDGA